MVAPVTVSEKDLRSLLGIVSDDRTDLPAEGALPLSLLADLMGQIRCDAVSFEGLDSNLRTEWFWQGIPDWDDDDEDLDQADQAHWEHYWDCKSCSYADLRMITMVSDFYSARQWHSTGMYCDFSGCWDGSISSFWPCPRGPAGPPGRGGPSGWSSTAGLARIFPSATARCWHCCAPTCTRPTWTPSAAATPSLG
jgi:hypothetical protein